MAKEKRKYTKRLAQPDLESWDIPATKNATPLTNLTPKYKLFKGAEKIELGGNRGGGDLYKQLPLEQLELGESFFIPKGDQFADSPGGSKIMYAISQFNKYVDSKKKFSQRMFTGRDENHQPIEGRMVWRIK